MYKGFYIQAFRWNAYYHLHLDKNRESDCCWCYKVVMIPVLCTCNVPLQAELSLRVGIRDFPWLLWAWSPATKSCTFIHLETKVKKTCPVAAQLPSKLIINTQQLETLLTDSPAWKGYVTRIIIYCFRSILYWSHNNSPFNHTQNAPVELWRRY